MLYIFCFRKTLPVDQLGGKPLCMTQYYKILSACRIPGKKHDDWVCFPSDKPNPPRHVTIIYNNTFFSLDCYGSDNKPLSESVIYKQLRRITDMANTPGEAVGILTTENRNKWAKSYNKLLKDKENKAILEDIQRSILVVCIDNKCPEDLSDERSVAARNMLHGLGSNYNSANRWFDKTLQFIVAPNGICGLNYEHTTAEGPPVIGIVDHVLDYCKSNKENLNVSTTTDVKAPRKLQFNLTDSVREDINEATQSLDSLVDDVDLTILEFTEYGKNFPKSQKLSPDSFIQMAFQLAYYRLYNEPCATYETASLRKFHLGRTDTIRSCSSESLEFCKGMQDPSKSKEERANLLRKAVTAHKMYTNEAVNGSGVDRHLLGLKLAAIESGMNVPDLHMDTAYTTSTYFKLSTSQVPAKYEAVLVFGPVVPDGYGLCYNPQETQILIGVSAFNNSPQTDSKKMIGALKDSFRDMRDTLAGSIQAKL